MCSNGKKGPYRSTNFALNVLGELFLENYFFVFQKSMEITTSHDIYLSGLNVWLLGVFNLLDGWKSHHVLFQYG